MTLKRKPEPDSPIDLFFDTMLFSKKYEFETSLPINVAIQRIHELSEEMHGWLYRKPRYNVTSENRYSHHVYDIRARDYRQQYTIAHTTGTVHSVDGQNTMVTGEIRFGVVYFLLLIFSVIWIFFLLDFVNISLPLWILGFALVIPTYTFINMVYQRNQLINKIQSAITPRISDRSFDKPKRTRKPLNEIYAELEHQFSSYSDDTPEQSDYDQR